MMHEKQPTHLLLSTMTAPSAMLSAPEMQLFTHSGSVQWRQETAKEMLLRSSMRMRGTMWRSLSALIIEDLPELANAQ